MKRVITKLLVAAVTAVSVVCCSRQRVIPDAELAMIFHDAFLANAFLANERVLSDTVDVYGPIFEKYGYTVEDVQYTIGNFSKRKSARLSDVVNAAMLSLDKENIAYRTRVAALDTIDAIGRRRFEKTVYTDTLVMIRKAKDTVGTVVTIPVEEAGDYEVSFRYRLDSADRNNNLRFDFYMINGRGRHRGDVVYRLKRGIRESYKRTFTADTSIRKLVLDLNPYAEKFEKPGLRIDTLVVRRYLPSRIAFDSLYRSLFDYAVPADYYNHIESYNARMDSLRLAVDSVRAAADSLSAAPVSCDSTFVE